MLNDKDSTWQMRLRNVITKIAILVLLGIGYAIFVHLTGLAIPCPLHLLTGWQCPGCGVTRMFLALLRFDFSTAYQYNPALFVLTPILGVVFLVHIVNYVRTGNRQLGRFSNIVLYICVGVLLVFGILRNVLPM